MTEKCPGESAGLFKIRKSVPSDIDRIELLFKEMMKSIYGSESTESYEPGYLDKFYAGDGNLVYAAESYGKLVAYLSVELHDEKVPFIYLDDMCVDEAFRDQGIGTALLKSAELYAIEKGIRQLYLHVESSNTGALKLYKRLGYIITAEEGTRYRMRKGV